MELGQEMKMGLSTKTLLLLAFSVLSTIACIPTNRETQTAEDDDEKVAAIDGFNAAIREKVKLPLSENELTNDVSTLNSDSVGTGQAPTDLNSIATPTGKSVVIDATVVRNEKGSGKCQISSGFPVPQGLVTEQTIRDGAVKVLVDGTEVAANVTALRGRHYDGSLRSMLIQFVGNMREGETVAAQVIVNSGTRAQPDPDYVLPTHAMVENNNVVLATDAKYLCSTQVTFRHLLPAGQGTDFEEAFYTRLAEDRFDHLADNPNFGTASYEHVNAQIAMWCRTGNRKYFNQAVNDILRWLPYNTPSADEKDGCLQRLVANPDGRESANSTCGIAAEWHWPRFYSYGSMYLLTGYRDFWGTVAAASQWALRDWNNEFDIDKVIYGGAYDNPRFNYAHKGYGSIIPALFIDATIPVNGQYHRGGIKDWEKCTEWAIAGLEKSAWDLKWIPFKDGNGSNPKRHTKITQGEVSAIYNGTFANKDAVSWSSVSEGTGFIQVTNVTGGSLSAGPLTFDGGTADAIGPEQPDYRQGMVGSRSWHNLKDESMPTFQLSIPINFLIDLYLYVKRDERIPPMVRDTVNVALNNMRPIDAESSDWHGAKLAKWGHAYVLQNPVAESKIRPWTAPMFARGVLFTLKQYGDHTVNGATYSTWYQRLTDPRLVDPSHLTWQWKHFGQMYGWNLDAPWMNSVSNIDDYTQDSMRKPTQWNAIPDPTPAVGKSK